ncbi:hypothetical protein INT47_004416 [Mucor saturninus]|uniref:Uncharacterized protein n=1 Tax=Mucor saturninus TaxID=64648 RepID=A0A8H7QZV5_9FUNG|nr:hypothetical protein INT47_004416 [Mucor saturninus]
MNNTEANNNIPKNVRGRGRGRGNGRGGRRRRGRHAGIFVFLSILPFSITPLLLTTSTPKLTTRHPITYNVWPEVAICILLEIMTGTYSYLLRKNDTALKQLIWDDPSIQPEVNYKSINMQESRIRSYRRFNDADLMNAIGSDGREMTYLGPTEVDQLVIQKAFADKYPARDYTNNEGPTVPSFNESVSAPTAPATAPAPTPTLTAVPTSTPTTEQPNNRTTNTNTHISIRSTTSIDRRSASTTTFVAPPPPPTSAPSPPRSTRTSRNSRTSGEQSLSTTDPIEAARQLSHEHMAHARQLGVEMMDRMAALQREDREQRLLDVDNMLQRISRNRQIALEDMQARRRQESRERYQMLEEARSRREADMEEHRRRRMSDMETILNSFAAIRRGDSDTDLNGSSSTDNNN